MNVFDVYKPKEKKFKIKALGDQEITLVDLSLEESTEISQQVVKGVKDDGQPDIDLKEANLTKYRKISKALIDPKMTTKQLRGLAEAASEALDEIYALVDPIAAKAIEEAKEEAREAKGKPKGKPEEANSKK